MKLLILTQKIHSNDDDLAFFILWVKEFIKQGFDVQVICLEKGDFDNSFPVYSLGKEKGAGKIKRILNFYKYIFTLKYDAVFVHMNPEYIMLGGWYWRLMKKKIALWYVHRSVTIWLKIANFFSNIIFSVVPESFNLKSKKVVFVGHGVDINTLKTKESFVQNTPLKIICAGRVSEIKNQKTLIETINILKKTGTNINLDIVGGCITKKDIKYKKKLEEMILNFDIVENINFLGVLQSEVLNSKYHEYDISVNLVGSGGTDKVVLESMVCGTPALFSYSGFLKFFSDRKDLLYFKQEDSKDLAEKIKKIIAISDNDYKNLSKDLARYTRKNFSIECLILKIKKSII